MRIPKYQLIEDELRHEIQNGKFGTGDRFYSEAELVARYNVSSITVIHAIRDLVSMGYLVRYQGRGTFVSRSHKHKLVEFTDIEIFANHWDDERVEVLSMEESFNPVMRARLGLSEEESYYTFERVRRINDEAFLVIESHIPSRFVIPSRGKDYYTSIYRRFREDFGLHLDDEHFIEQDSIVFPAPDHATKLLGLQGNVPCVRQEKLTTLSDGQVAEHALSYKRWDYFKIEFETRDGVFTQS